MVKLALCFSGDTRTYDKCFESIKHNLLDKFDCHVFISTYHTNNEIKDNIINLYKPKKYNFHDKNKITEVVSKYSNDLDFVKMNPVNVFESNISFSDLKCTNNFEDYFFNYNDFEAKFIYKKIFPNALGQFFGIYDVSKLCKEYMIDYKINYDFILRIRLDNYFCSNFILNNDLEENEIVINCVQNYSNSIKLHDHFFMCKPETFFKISSLYDNINNVIQTINNNKCWLPSSGYQETLFLIQTMLHNVKIKHANFACIKQF